jgi:hypothetical protein
MSENTFTLRSTPGNNHGCLGFSVEIEPTSETEGVVVGGYSCNSCWQVGHDDSEPWPPVGTRVRLPETMPSRKVWVYGEIDRRMTAERRIVLVDDSDYYVHGEALPRSWGNAALLAGYSHNELVDTSDDPHPDSSLVRPSDLVIVE